jgi:hypothetical protein
MNSQKICYGYFHIESNPCLFQSRHARIQQLVQAIDDRWKNLEIETISHMDVSDAIQSAKNFGIQFSPKGYVFQGEKGWKRGEVCLWVGTILALRKFLESEHEYMLLFEDDVIVKENSVDLVESYINLRRFDLFSFFAPESSHELYGRKRNMLQYIQSRTIDNPTRITKAYQPSCLVSYAVSRNGASRILNSVKNGIDAPLDWHLFSKKFKGLSLKPSGPWPFDMDDLPSTIQRDRRMVTE